MPAGDCEKFGHADEHGADFALPGDREGALAPLDRDLPET